MTFATHIAITAAAILLTAESVATTQGNRPGAALPERLEHYLTYAVKLTPDERNLLLSGRPVAKLLEGDPDKELAVFAAAWVRGSMRRYVEAVKDIETFERGGGFKITKRIRTPPQLSDFQELRIPDEDLDDLRSCRVGSCAVKLGEQALEQLRSKIDWSAPNARTAVNTLIQRLALEYVTRYLEGGNAQLAVYRDRSRPRFVAEEFRAMVDQMPELTTYMPDVRRYLLEYPNATMADATSFVYWQEVQFGLKPTIRVSHMTVREGPADALVMSKMLYASHYFWTGLELRALLSDSARGDGFWLVTVSRSRSDGLGGFTGMFVRGRAGSEAEQGALAALQWTKNWLESEPR
jgi:hypothetical protein